MGEVFRDKFAIVGLGMVTGKLFGVSARTMQVEATRLAMEDAGLTRIDIDGSIDLKRAGGGGDRPSWTDAFPRVLGLPVKFYFTIGRGGALVSLGIIAAAKMLELGVAKYVALTGAVADLSWSRKGRERNKEHRGQWGSTEKSGRWAKAFGDVHAACHHSFFASRHMYEYGTTSRQLGAISVAERQWALMNPRARMHGIPMTIEDHQNSPIFVYPYHMLDVCLISDGAISFILTTADRAKDLAKPPVFVMGVGFGEAIEKLWWEKANYTCLAVATAKEQAFSQAGIGVEDIDLAQLYDCFTAECLFQLEDYGWCKKGEGGPFVEEGHIGPGGDIPVNTSGGLLSAYHYGDLTGLSEAVIQLRGEAGERQVKDAEICLVSGHGGEILSPGMASTHTSLILRR